MLESVVTGLEKKGRDVVHRTKFDFFSDQCVRDNGDPDFSRFRDTAIYKLAYGKDASGSLRASLLAQSFYEIPESRSFVCPEKNGPSKKALSRACPGTDLLKSKNINNVPETAQTE